MGILDLCLNCSHRIVCKRWEVIKEAWNFAEYEGKVPRSVKFKIASVFGLQIPDELIDKLDWQSLSCAFFEKSPLQGGRQ